MQYLFQKKRARPEVGRVIQNMFVFNGLRTLLWAHIISADASN